MLTWPLEVVRCRQEFPPMLHTDINSSKVAVRKFILDLEVIVNFVGLDKAMILTGQGNIHEVGEQPYWS